MTGLKRPYHRAFGAVATAYQGVKRLRSYAKTYRKRPNKGIRSKGRPRYGGSRTKTKTKKRSQRSWDRDGNGIAYKTDTLTYKKNRKFKLTEILTQKTTFARLYSGGTTGPQGYQSINANLTGVTSTDLKSFYTQLNSGAPVLPYGATVSFNLTQIKYELEFNNCGPATIEMDIYHLIDKNTCDTAQNAKTVWSAGLVAEEGALYVANNENPWMVPTHVKRFNLNWWTRRYTKSLSPGEKIKLTLIHNVNRVLDWQHLDAYETIRGITSSVMIVQRGTICDGNNDPVVTVDRQTLCRTKTVHLVKIAMVGQLLQSKPKANVMINQLPLAFVNPLYDQNEGPGAPQDTENGTEYA